MLSVLPLAVVLEEEVVVVVVVVGVVEMVVVVAAGAVAIVPVVNVADFRLRRYFLSSPLKASLPKKIVLGALQFSSKLLSSNFIVIPM